MSDVIPACSWSRCGAGSLNGKKLEGGAPLGVRPVSVEHVLLSAAATFGALFPIVNPVAKVPIFLGLSEGFSPVERRALARRVALIVAAILLLALFGGRFLLHFFGVSL